MDDKRAGASSSRGRPKSIQMKSSFHLKCFVYQTKTKQQKKILLLLVLELSKAAPFAVGRRIGNYFYNLVECQ